MKLVTIFKTDNEGTTPMLSVCVKSSNTHNDTLTVESIIKPYIDVLDAIVTISPTCPLFRCVITSIDTVTNIGDDALIISIKSFKRIVDKQKAIVEVTYNDLKVKYDECIDYVTNLKY